MRLPGELLRRPKSCEKASNVIDLTHMLVSGHSNCRILLNVWSARKLKQGLISLLLKDVNLCRSFEDLDCSFE